MAMVGKDEKCNFLHVDSMLADVKNKGQRLDVAKKWFDRVMWLNALNATEGKAPLSYKEVEDVMKAQLRDQYLYEYPRGVSTAGMVDLGVRMIKITMCRGCTESRTRTRRGQGADGYGAYNNNGAGAGGKNRNGRGRGGAGTDRRGGGRNGQPVQPVKPEKYGIA